MKVQVSHRLDEGLLAWATEYAETRSSSRAIVIEEALRHFQALAKGGVPDMPVATEPSREQQEANKAALKFARQAAEPTRPTQHDYNMARQQQLNAAKYRQAK